MKAFVALVLLVLACGCGAKDWRDQLQRALPVAQAAHHAAAAGLPLVCAPFEQRCQAGGACDLQALKVCGDVAAYLALAGRALLGLHESLPRLPR